MNLTNTILLFYIIGTGRRSGKDLSFRSLIYFAACLVCYEFQKE